MNHGFLLSFTLPSSPPMAYHHPPCPPISWTCLEPEKHRLNRRLWKHGDCGKGGRKIATLDGKMWNQKSQLSNFVGTTLISSNQRVNVAHPKQKSIFKTKKCRCCIERDVPCHFGAGTLKSYIYIQASVFLIVFSRQTSRCGVAVLMGRGGGDGPDFKVGIRTLKGIRWLPCTTTTSVRRREKNTWKNSQEMFRIRFACPKRWGTQSFVVWVSSWWNVGLRR